MGQASSNGYVNLGVRRRVIIQGQAIAVPLRLTRRCNTE